jgi:DNA-directed DNA polymerase III PolC
MENGIIAHAITDHGHMNAYAGAQLWIEKHNKENPTKPFKYLPGVEVYFHPDLKQWERDKASADQARIDKKEAKKLQSKQEQLQTKLLAVTDANDETVDIEMSNALTVENEEESKSTKHFNPVNRRHHLVLLPKNDRGLQKLFGIVSYGYLHGFYRFPRIDTSVLREACKDGDIIASSACVAGQPSWEIFQVLQQYKFDELDQRLLDDPAMLEKCVTAVGNAYDLMTSAVGKENYYLELQFNRLPAQNLVNRAILEFAQRNGVTQQLTVTCDAHYARKELWKEREIYRKLGFMKYTDYSPDSLPKSVDDLKCELYPKNVGQVWDEYLRSKEGTSFYNDQLICDTIERTHDIAFNVIGTVKPDRSPKYPKNLVPVDRTPIKHLTKMCMQGLIERGLADKPEYIERLKEELGIIKAKEFAEYFITYAKIMELAHTVCLCGVGRGSGGGSLVNYVLRITDLDPIRWDLPFARFLTIYREEAPDIDSDVSDRDKLLEQLRNYFGFENVVPISNYNTMKVKSLVKDLSKFYGIPYEEVGDATRTVEEDVRKATAKNGDDKNLFVLTYEDSLKHSPPFKTFIDRHPQIGSSMQVLFKQNRSLGRHAGGVLIVDDLPNRMPLVTSKGEPQSPFVEGTNAKHLEKIGNFVKFDLLGLETLRLIERTIELILMKQGNAAPTFADVKAWYDANMAPDVVDFNDKKVYEYVYHEGRWAGCFQATQKGSQNFFKRSKPYNIDDLAAITSIFRPGPLAAHVDDLYIKARKGDVYDWGDERINDVLKKTYGCLIFQEQVMELAEKIAGFPKQECDRIRRAIMKRSISGLAKNRQEANDIRITFVEGCVKNGFKEETANQLYDRIAFFAGYGFNRAHAVAYAIDSWYCAYLLTHHEQEWLTAYLERMSRSPDDRAKAFTEVKGIGYNLVPIDINHATAGWTGLPGKKFMPSFLSCKGVGQAAVEEIVANRPYNKVEDVLWNEDGTWRHSKFNKRALETLIKVGAFTSLDCVGENKMFRSYRHMHSVIIEHIDEIKKSPKKDPHAGRRRFYELIRELHEACPEWTRVEQGAMKIELQGTLDVASMFDVDLIARLEAKGVTSIDEVDEDKKDIHWFAAQSVTQKKTKTGKKYLQMEAVGAGGRAHRLNVWNWDGMRVIEPFVLYIAEVRKDGFGCSTTTWKLKEVA